MKKRSMSLLLVLVMVFSLLPFSALAAETAVTVSGSLTDTRIALSATTDNTSGTANWSATGTTVTGYVAGEEKDNWGTSNINSKIVLKNNSSETQTLSFDYELLCYSNDSYLGKMKIGNGSEITVSTSGAKATGDYSVELAANSSLTINVFSYKGAEKGRNTTLTLTNVNLTGGSTTPDDPIHSDEIDGGDGYYYKVSQTGLKVGDPIDLSQTYYVNLNEDDPNAAPVWKEVEINKGAYYDWAGNSWTASGGAGKYFMMGETEFYPVGADYGKWAGSSGITNQPIVGKDSDNPVIRNSEQHIGAWTSGLSTDLVYQDPGDHQFYPLMYDTYGQSGKLRYDLWLYYDKANGNRVYLNRQPEAGDTPSGAPNGGFWIYSHSGMTGYYNVDTFSGYTVYRGGLARLYYVDKDGKNYIGNQAASATDIVFTQSLYDLSDEYGAVYFAIKGQTPDEAKLSYLGQVDSNTSNRTTLTPRTLYTRRAAHDTQVLPDTGEDASMGTLVDTTNNFKGNLFIQKRLYRNDATGEYNIKLESWATGNMNTTGGGGPTDIVLVVDLSNSMWQSNTKDLIDENNQPMYRSEAVIRAISSFIDTLHDADPNGENYRVSIVSFSGTPNTSGNPGYVYLFDGQNYYYSTNDINSHATSSLKPVDDAGVAALKQSINTGVFKEPKGDNTYPVHGLNLAQTVLSNRTTYTDRPATVIMFTDGTPGTGTGRGASKYADPAIDQAYNLKHNFNATIYTVGLFNFRDDDPDNKMGFIYDEPKKIGDTVYDPGTYTVKEYMEAVSSKYPNAQTEEIPGYVNPTITSDKAHWPVGLTPENNDQQYYFKVDTSQGNVGIQALLDAFGDIATTIAETDVPVDENSILCDMINTTDFALPNYVPDGDNATVKIEVVEATEINSKKQIQWGDVVEADGIVKSPILDENNYLKGVDVSGFNYQQYFSAPAGAGQGSKKGRKLVVKLFGLMPKHGGVVHSNLDAGIYNPIVDEPDHANKADWELYLDVESPDDTITSRSFIVDFNAKMKIAESGYMTANKASALSDKNVDVIKQRGLLSGPPLKHGSFIKNANQTADPGTIIYQLAANDTVVDTGKTDESGNPILETAKDYTFIGADTAMVFGQYYDGERSISNPGFATVDLNKQVINAQTGESTTQTYPAEKAWQTVNMIPASSVYYDDDFVDKQAVEEGDDPYVAPTVTVGDGSGYNAGVSVTAPTTPEEKGHHYYTFTGTGIDVYCTTESSSATIKAWVDDELVTMNNYAKETRYNVPTVSFRNLEYGKHVLKLTVLGSSNYKIDGMRIYGTNADNQELYNDTTEQYAVYVNMREAMLTPSSADEIVTVNGASEQSGVLFVDENDKLTLKQQTVELDENMQPKVDKDGNPIMKTVYTSEFQAYKNISPKNEIYLAKNESVTFTLTGTAKAAKNVWIGLSAPGSVDGGGSVTINGGDPITVDNALDQYYPIDVPTSGSIIITNNGDAMISITNLKLTGDENLFNAAADVQKAYYGRSSEDGRAMAVAAEPTSLAELIFEPVTLRTVMLAANNGVDPEAVSDTPEVPDEPDTPDEPGTPDDPKPGWDDSAINPMNILKNLFKLLLNSLSDLFRGLGGW